jgi:hypothetical protein
MRFRLIAMVLIMSVPAAFNAQSKSARLVYYQDESEQRPVPFEYVNAQKVIHEKWGLEYRSAEGVDTSDVRVGNIKFNEAISQRHGEAWMGKLMGEVKMVLSSQSKIRLLIENHSVYKSMDSTELFIEIQPKGKKHICKIVGQQVQGDKKPYVIFGKAIYNVKNDKLKFKSSKVKPLDFEYPKHGVVIVE